VCPRAWSAVRVRPLEVARELLEQHADVAPPKMESEVSIVCALRRRRGDSIGSAMSRP
jgi:hypothetical protein